MTRVRGLSALGILAAIALSACGKSSDSTQGKDSDLSSMPSVSSMVSSSKSSLTGLDEVLAVTGTPPKLIDINDTNVDTYFWNGLLATLASSSSATEAQKQEFFAGEARCRLAQNIGHSMEFFMRAETTGCMLKGIKSASSGVTVTGSTTSQSEVFKQGESDKTILITPKGFAAATGGDTSKKMEIFAKVYGTNSVTDDSYKIELWFCRGGSVNETQTISLTRSTGAYSNISTQNQTWGTGSMTIAASLKLESDGTTWVFDSSKDRTGDVLFSHSMTLTGGSTMSNTMKANLTNTSGGQLTTKLFMNNTFSGTLPDGTSATSNNSNKVFAISNNAGTTLDDFSINEGAGSISMSGSSGSNTFAFTSQGGMEWSTSTYAAVTSSTLLDTAKATDLKTGFYSAAATVSTPDFSSYSCTGTPDVTVTMDFSDANVQAFPKKCMPDKAGNKNFCDGAGPQKVRQLMFRKFTK